jgi:hypothetical protein
MKIKCENVVVCGNYKCTLNQEGKCIRAVVALDATGKCSMACYAEKSVAPATAAAK